MFLNNPNIGMTPNERLVLSASFGIKPNGEHSDSGPQTNNAIGQQLGVSAVRISQIKANAINKIKEFLITKGAFTPAKALEKFDLEESKDIMRKIAESMINVLYESVNLQIDFTNGIQIVPITISEDVIKFHVDVDNKTIKDITNKDNISVMDIDKKYINKAIDNDFSGNIIDVCPVGALTDKTYRFKSRVWFSKPVEAHCDCEKCSGQVTLWYKGDEVIRVTGRKNQWGEVKEFICNTCRFDRKKTAEWTIEGPTQISRHSVISANKYGANLIQPAFPISQAARDYKLINDDRDRSFLTDQIKLEAKK
jgi:hypothetical protein